MRFYFEFTKRNYHVRHAIAIELKKLFPDSVFAGKAPPSGDTVRKYLQEQTDIQYEFLHDFHKLSRRSLEEQADFELLREFEEKLPEKSLWRIIAVDREWGYQFVKGVYLLNNFIHTINSQDNILRVVSGAIKFFKNVLADFKPDAVIAAAGQNNILCPIIEQLCSQHGVLYLIPETVRTQNYMALTDNRQYVFSQVNDICQKLINKKLNFDLSAGEKCYNEIIADLENTNYFDVSRIGHLQSNRPFLKFLYTATRSATSQLIRWQKEKRIRQNPDILSKQPDTAATLMNNIWFVFAFYYRRMKMMNPSFYSPFDPKLKYVYYPLHNSNEYSTQVQGTMWIDQLPIIEALAKSIPFDWKVVIKEHPGMLLYRLRPMAFYKEIKKYSNVLLIPTDTSSHKVIDNAKLIVTIVGTSGWEAIIRGKPVISFEENMYDSIGLSRRCSDFKELSVAVHDEIKRISGISAEERRRRIICLLTAIVRHGFWINDPLKVTGDADCESNEEAQQYGKIIASAIKDYIDYKKINA